MRTAKSRSFLQNFRHMHTPTDPKEKERSPEEVKQQQSDPNLTELKGLTDPDEKLEPEGTDNPIDNDSKKA
jgi:hypothetical protein